MATSNEVYNYEARIESLLARVSPSNIPEENKKAIEGFNRYLVANGQPFENLIGCFDCWPISWGYSEFDE